MAKQRKTIGELIQEDKPLFKRDNIHLTLQEVDGYNKPDNYLITTRGMGKSTICWAKVYKEFKEGLCSIIQKNRPVEVTQMWINDIAAELNKFRKPSQYCETFKHRGSNLKDGCLDIDIKDPLFPESMEKPMRLCRVICISIDVKRFKSLVLPNAGSIFADEFIPDIRHGEKWLNGYVWRANTLWTTFGRFTYETRGAIQKRYWFGNPYSRYIPPLFEQYNIDTTELKPGALLVGDQYVVSLAQPSKELKDLLKKENPSMLNDINKEWQDFMNGQFTADSNYDICKVQPKGFKLHWVFKICNTYIGVFRKSGDHEYSWENPREHSYWITVLPKDYTTKQHDILAFDFNNFVQGGRLVLSEDKANLACLRTAIAYRRCLFSDTNAASIVETMYTSL